MLRGKIYNFLIGRKIELRVNAELEERLPEAINVCIAERYAQKEQDIKNAELNLLRRLNKSREYRIMLRDYQSELREREKALDARDANLDVREKNIKDIVLRQFYDKQSELEARESRIKEYETALRRTELTLLDWFKRVDRKEAEIYEEISSEISRVKDHPVKIDGYSFEVFVSKYMEKKGFTDVTITQKSNDFGADILASKDGVSYVVQCKCYSSSVGIEAVQEVYAAKGHYNSHVAIVATNNVFTKAAKTLADELKVVLWDCLDLSE